MIDREGKVFIIMVSINLRREASAATSIEYITEHPPSHCRLKSEEQHRFQLSICLVHNGSDSLAAAAASLVSSVSAAATTGDFNVLTMNVAGLPAILNGNDVPGDKTTNSLLIGTLLAKYDYDIVHVQEGQLKLDVSSAQ